jgi:hypothetical protein
MWKIEMKRHVKAIIPRSVLQLVQRYRLVRLQRGFDGLDPSQAFSKIYEERLWGRSIHSDHDYCSGSGSSNPEIVGPYVESIRAWLRHLPNSPSVGDLGCGDFSVGSQLTDLASTWTSYDCVPSLIASNRRKFVKLQVQFKELDLCAEAPEPADVYFLRQVLQHLSNSQIQQVLDRVVSQCRWLVLTEHLPTKPFTPNKDKPVGPDVRVLHRSGVDVTQPPFNCTPVERVVLCRVIVSDGEIVTEALRFK